MTHIKKELSQCADARRALILFQGQVKCMEADPNTPKDILRNARNRLTLAQSQYQEAKKRTRELIRKVPQELNMREILTRRYINLMSWNDVSESMYLDKRWIMRLHKRALEFLATHK